MNGSSIHSFNAILLLEVVGKGNGNECEKSAHEREREFSMFVDH